MEEISSDGSERSSLLALNPQAARFIRRLYGSADYISGEQRYCLWITDEDEFAAKQITHIAKRLEMVRAARLDGGEVARGLVSAPHRFRYTHVPRHQAIIIPRVSSERREYLPAGLLELEKHCRGLAQAIYDPPLWVFAIISSKLHLLWAKTTSGKLKSDIRYSSGLSYNTFPISALTEQNRSDLTRCAQSICLPAKHIFRRRSPTSMTRRYARRASPGPRGQ